MEEKRTLYRNTDDRILGGVASGLAEYMNWDVTLVRLAFVFCLFAVQGSVLAYILAWIIVPAKGCPSKSFGIGMIILLLLIAFLPALLALTLFGAVFFKMLVAFL